MVWVEFVTASVNRIIMHINDKGMGALATCTIIITLKGRRD